MVLTTWSVRRREIKVCGETFKIGDNPNHCGAKKKFSFGLMTQSGQTLWVNQDMVGYPTSFFFGTPDEYLEACTNLNRFPLSQAIEPELDPLVYILYKFIIGKRLKAQLTINSYKVNYKGNEYNKIVCNLERLWKYYYEDHELKFISPFYDMFYTNMMSSTDERKEIESRVYPTCGWTEDEYNVYKDVFPLDSLHYIVRGKLADHQVNSLTQGMRTQ
jgi:hypothetical protein